jgi:nicotinic acid phosphoribosyltransferase
MSSEQQHNSFRGTTAEQQKAVKEVDHALEIESLREEIDQFLSSKHDVIQLNQFIVDFFNGMKKNLGDYHMNHPSRIEFNANLVKIFDELIRVLSLFEYDATGALLPTVGSRLITGTTHNDYYKFTMAPVIYWAENVTSEPVIVCFVTELRDSSLAQKLLANQNDITTDVINALHNLASLEFNPDIVAKAVDGKPIATFWDKHSKRIFGTQAFRKTLARTYRPDGANPNDFHENTVIYNRQLTPADVAADGKVALAVYVGPNAKHTIDPTQPPTKVYIEAMGPWGRVSLLETTMMQTVYAVALRHHLREQQKTYGQWLYEAMFRCHLSMRDTQTECPNMSGALFSGRRTGHHVLTLLQVLYQSRFQTGEGGVGKCIGTSSVDAWYTLFHQLKFPKIVPPAGTHAHELSMVFASLFPQLDQLGAPFSQALSHALYYTLVHQGHPVPMPMLPDTLGSEACLIALASCWIQKMENGAQTGELVRLLSVIGSARQDSGKLEAFKALMDLYKSSPERLMIPDLGMMASEIDDKDSMKTAHSLGYKTYGTGGYMGDSEKAWRTTDVRFSASMAVKAVRVFVGPKQQKSPIKLGDGKADDTLKITGDTSMEFDSYLRMIQDAIHVKETAIKMVQSGCLVSHNQPVLRINQQTGEVVIYLNGSEIGRLIPRCWNQPAFE